MIEMIRGLAALRDAAEDNRNRGKFFFGSFVDAVQAGVSANLCEALTASSDHGKAPFSPIEVGVTWSYAVGRSATLPSTAVRFDSSTVSFIRQAAGEFRARNPEVVTLNGWVHILERESLKGPGLVRILTRIDDRAIAVRARLRKEHYEAAIDAHKSGSFVTVTGTLIVEGAFSTVWKNLLIFASRSKAVSWSRMATTEFDQQLRL